MKRFIIFIFINIISSSLFGQESPHLLNANEILMKYGINKFSKGMIEIRKINDDLQDTIGEIEGAANIDTPEEAATGFILCDKKFNKELALQACAMWLKKKAEQDKPEAYKASDKAIAIIKQKLKVSDSEIRDYYSQGIQNTIIELAKKHFGSSYSIEKIQPLIDFYNGKSSIKDLYIANAKAMWPTFFNFSKTINSENLVAKESYIYSLSRDKLFKSLRDTAISAIIGTMKNNGQDWKSTENNFNEFIRNAEKLPEKERSQYQKYIQFLKFLSNTIYDSWNYFQSEMKY